MQHDTAMSSILSPGTRVITKDPLIKYAIIVKHIEQKDYTGLWGTHDASTRMYRIVDAVDGVHYADLFDAFFRLPLRGEAFPIIPYTKIIKTLYKAGIIYHCDETATV